MKPELLVVSDDSIHSFTFREDSAPVNSRWHYHPEIELIHFKDGQGTRFIGDSINHFSDGEMFLIGSFLPHYWRIGDKYIGEHKTERFCLSVVHFKENFWGEQFVNLPENKALKRLFDDARRGLQIQGETKSEIAALMTSIGKTEGLNRILSLLKILSILAESKEVKSLSGNIIKSDLKEIEKKRINIIYDYAVQNIKNTIALSEIAAVSNLSPKSFCRYFKSITRKTFSQFMAELRVGNACKLLLEGNMELKKICYECGFNNLSGFHKCFKTYLGKSPKQYQQEYLINH